MGNMWLKLYPSAIKRCITQLNVKSSPEGLKVEGNFPANGLLSVKNPAS